MGQEKANNYTFNWIRLFFFLRKPKFTVTATVHNLEGGKLEWCKTLCYMQLGYIKRISILALIVAWRIYARKQDSWVHREVLTYKGHMKSNRFTRGLPWGKIWNRGNDSCLYTGILWLENSRYKEEQREAQLYINIVWINWKFKLLVTSKNSYPNAMPI